MTRTLNKVMLIGNVGKDPEIKYTPSGVPVTSFRLATTESWKDRDGFYQEHTEWHTVVAWRGLAEVVYKIVKKGARIYIEGRLHSRSFEDKGGNKKYVTEILADSMLLLDVRKGRDDNYEDYHTSDAAEDPIDFHLVIDKKYDTDFDDEIHPKNLDFPF